MRTRSLSILLLVAALSACGSLTDGLGSLGDILGSTGVDKPSDIRGTVTNIDTRSQTINMDVDTVNQLRDARPNSTIYWDSNTVVQYQGQTYRPDALERGDVIEVAGVNQDGRYIARTIRVIRDVS